MNERIVQVRDNRLNVRSTGCVTLPTIVFLHGFTGSVDTWQSIFQLLKGRFHMIAVDLTGHGKSAVPDEPACYSMKEQVADLEALFEQLDLREFTLVGYSMGGRIALAYTVQHPSRVHTLILESASPGLKSDLERMNRRESDQKLADRIIAEGVPAFVSFWENIPLFDSQKHLPFEKRMSIRQERLRHTAKGLSNSLLGIGTGSQPSYWSKLSTITVPVFLITGEIDRKFVNIAREMEKSLPFSIHRTIKGAGHAIHVEKPDLFATIVEKYLNELKI